MFGDSPTTGQANLIGGVSMIEKDNSGRRWAKLRRLP